MNEIPKFAAPKSVTTGPIVRLAQSLRGARRPADIRVPFREIALSDPSEPPVRVYDPSGPYTENVVADRSRAWASARARGLDRGERLSAAKPRAIRPEDNGNVSADHLAPLCPAKRTLRADKPGQLVTQFEFARAGIVTEEMIYVAHRENLAREAAVEERKGPHRRRRELRRGYS